MGHLFPEFHNWKFATNLQVSKLGHPYALYLNFDKPFIGLFPLLFSIPLLTSQIQLRSIFIKTITLTTLGITTVLSLAHYLHFIAIALKLPNIWPIWLIVNLFLMTIPEEAFFRGFLQRELVNCFQSQWAMQLSIIMVSSIFSLLHFAVFPNPSHLLLTFIASLIYGEIYHTTQAIESTICCHYLLNVAHFFCFTYPALS